MKMKILFTSILLFIAIVGWGQEKLKIFGVTFKAKAITGINKFNDLGTIYNTTVINDLTDDKNTYYWRLGTVRKDKNDYTRGTFSLFDLSNYNHKESYPILDEIDFNYYSEVGFNLLQANDNTLLENKPYTDFKRIFLLASSLKEKRAILWNDSNSKWRDMLLKSRYYVNTQKLNNDVTKVFTKNLTDSLSLNFDKITSDTTLKEKLKIYWNNYKKKHSLFQGEYVSLTFQPRYIGIANYVIRGLDQSKINIIDDEFNMHLMDYIKDSCSFSLNSAVFAIKLTGSYDVNKIDSLDIKNELKIDISPNVANNLKIELNRKMNSTFKNEFDKVWIIMFATDAEMDELIFNDRHYIAKKKNTVSN